MANYLTENIYYNSSLLNRFNVPIPAETNDQLLAPIIKDSSNFNLAINQAKIPIGTIPLTQTNIDLHAYEITLTQNELSASSYVPQVGQTTSNFLYNATSGSVVRKYQYSTLGVLTLISTRDLSAILPYSNMLVVDQYENYYIVGGQTPTAKNVLVVVNTIGTVLLTQNFDLIQAFTIGRDENLYIANEPVGSPSELLVFLNDNSPTSCQLTLQETITQGYDGVLTTINTVCVSNNIIVGYDNNKVAIYDTNNYALVSGFQNEAITYLGKASQIISDDNSYVLTDDGISNDLFYGVPDGSSAMVNMTTGSTYVSGSWNPPSKMCLTDTTGYGIQQTTTDLLSFSPSIPPTGTPAQIGTETGYGNSVKYPKSETGCIFNGVGGDIENLYALNLDNLTNNAIYPFTTQALPDGDGIYSFDYQTVSNKIFAINIINNLLYQTNIGMYPKQALLDGTTGNFFQQGSAYNTFENTQSASLIQNQSVSGVAPVNYGCYKSLSTPRLNILRVDDNIIESVYLNMPGFTLGNVQAIVIPGTPAYTYLSETGLSTGYYAVCGDFSTGANVFILEESALGGDATIISSITLLNPINPLIQPRMIGYSNYLVIVNGFNLYIYDVADPATPTLLLNVENPVGTFENKSNSYSVTACNNEIYIVCDDPLQPFNVALYRLTPNVGWTAITSTTRIDSFEPTKFNPTIQRNSLSANETLNEISLVLITNKFQVYNGGTLTLTSFVSVTNNTTQGNFFYVLGNIDDTYTWIPIVIPVNNANITIQGIAISTNNPNDFYVINTSDKLVYKGSFNQSSSALVGVSRYLPITGQYSSINITGIASSLIYNTVLYEYNVSSQTSLATKSYGNIHVSSIGRDGLTSQFLIGKEGVGVDYLKTNGLTTAQPSSLLNSTFQIFALNGEDLDAGSVAIYDMQVLINQINLGFLQAFNKIVAKGSSFQSAPYLTLNFQNGLLTLNYASSYSAEGSGITFNTALLVIAYFLNTAGQIVLNPNAESILQSSPSVYQFNQLDQLLFESNSLFVNGTYFSLISTSRIITDIAVDTSAYVNNLNEVVIYNPQILRSFKMNSNLPVNRINMKVSYQYKDGTTYALLLDPGTNFTVKINFIGKS